MKTVLTIVLAFACGWSAHMAHIQNPGVLVDDVQGSNVDFRSAALLDQIEVSPDSFPYNLQPMPRVTEPIGARLDDVIVIEWPDGHTLYGI